MNFGWRSSFINTFFNFKTALLVVKSYIQFLIWVHSVHFWPSQTDEIVKNKNSTRFIGFIEYIETIQISISGLECLKIYVRPLKSAKNEL